jgi:pyruvate dehydrogenase E1 component beta subunit
MLAALQAEGPVVFLEHKLLADYWLDYLGAGGRESVAFDVPAAGARGWVEEPIAPLPFGVAATRRRGEDVSIVSLGVGAHRALEAAETLAGRGVDAGVVDLRCVAPLDRGAIVAAAASGRVLVVDEDYVRGGLSGEVAAVLAEERTGAAFARVAVTDTLPYARRLEEEALPNVPGIVAAAERLVEDRVPAAPRT